jgi:hypothetical protein
LRRLFIWSAAIFRRFCFWFDPHAAADPKSAAVIGAFRTARQKNKAAEKRRTRRTPMMNKK